MCSACAASQMSQYILTPMLLCVGGHILTLTLLLGAERGEELTPQKPLP